MKKTVRVILCILIACSVLCACEKNAAGETVSLQLWGSEIEQELLQRMSDEFCEHYSSEAQIDITIGLERESDFREHYLRDVEGSADVFSFADDQLYELVEKKSLLPVTQNADLVIADNGGEMSSSVQSAMCDGELYAYPKTASNGYFMFYNSQYFFKEDLESFDAMLKRAEKHKKKIYMDWSSGWYLYSFFGGAGFELKLNPDGLTNSCDWNGTSGKYKGTDVAEAMLKISASDAFFSGTNEEYIEGVDRGEIIAGVSGTWNVEKISRAYGQYYAADKLPCYTICGDQVQMSSFSGYKLVGVNATTEHPEWAQKLALWITNEENQKLRFEQIGEGPSNLRAAQSDSVQKAPAIVALSKQRPYSIVQNVGRSFWDAATTFGMIMISGNKDHLDLQELLDELVEQTEAPFQ